MFVFSNAELLLFATIVEDCNRPFATIPSLKRSTDWAHGGLAWSPQHHPDEEATISKTQTHH